MAITREQFFDDDLMAQVPELAAGIFPDQELTDAERAEMGALESRAARLSPIDIPSPVGSTQIPGNPYSYDVSPVLNAVTEGLTRVMNAARQRRLLGDPEKAEELESEAARVESQARDTEGGMDAIRTTRKLIQKSRKLKDEANKEKGVAGRLRELREKEARAAAAQEGRQQFQQDVAGALVQHGLSMKEIQQRHLNRLAEIEEKFGTEGGPKMSAALLGELSDSVTAMQETIRGEINQLRTEELQLLNAKGDEELEKRMQKRLPEGVTIDERLAQIPAERSEKRRQLDQSVDELIRVSARRNNLDEASIRRLMGLEAEEGGGDGSQTAATGERTEGSKTITSEVLGQYAERHFEGDTERAREVLEANGYTIND